MGENEYQAEPQFGEDEEPPWPSSPEEMEADYPEDVAEQADFADDELDLVEPEASPTVAISPVVVPPWRCSLDLLKEGPPEIEWVIQGIITRESVVLLSGREGCMKTWLALCWAHACHSDSRLAGTAKLPGEPPRVPGGDGPLRRARRGGFGQCRQPFGNGAVSGLGPLAGRNAETPSTPGDRGGERGRD